MKRIITILCFSVFLTVCANAVNDSSFGDVNLEKTTEGVKYKKFQIENCTFIGTQDDEEVWHYAGPISCSKQVPAGNQY